MKNILMIIYLLFIVLSLDGCINTNSTKNKLDLMYSETQTNKEKAIKLINSFNSLKKESFSIISSEIFTQHNLTIADGKENYWKAIEAMSEKGLKVKIIRALQDEEYVFLQSKYTFDSGEVIVYDIFRFEDGIIVEHWDNKQEVKPPNPSGHNQIDGPIQIIDKDKTAQNKQLARDYLTALLVDKQIEKVDQFVNGNHYIQHNSDVADGLNSIKAVILKFEKEGIDIGYHKIHSVIGEGNFVLTMNEGYYGNQLIAYFDLIRIENGKIAEHWDVIEAIPPESKWKNKNGKF